MLEAGREPLRALLARGELPERLRAAAQKSLGELGELQMAPALWWGLGSDDAYTRYLSNLGMRGLTGRDLMEFGYTSPWEGAFVSGPNVVTMQGLHARITCLTATCARDRSCMTHNLKHSTAMVAVRRSLNYLRPTMAHIHKSRSARRCCT